MQGYKADLARLKASLRGQQAAYSRGQGTRTELGLSSDDAQQSSARHRERLLSSTAQLEKTGQRLTQSRQMMVDMEVGGLG